MKNKTKLLIAGYALFILFYSWFMMYTTILKCNDPVDKKELIELKNENEKLERLNQDLSTQLNDYIQGGSE